MAFGSASGREALVSDTILAVSRTRLFSIFLGLATAAMFAITTFAAGSYRAKRAQLAQQWFTRGEQRLPGDPKDAVNDFRTALTYSRDNRRYSLELARALVSAKRTGEARSYLLSLERDHPGDALVNLELARLEATAGNRGAAVQYYRDAIYGAWPDDPERRRIAARLELAQLLLQTNDFKDARAELVAATAELPRDPVLRTRAGTMLLDAGAYADALQQFRSALELDRRSPDAVRGAARAAYLMGDYAQAAQYSRRVLQWHPRDAAAAEMLRTSELVLDNDPFAPALSAAERRRRALRDFQYAARRLQACAQPSGELDALRTRAAKLRLTPAALARDPDLLDSAMALVFDIESATTRLCGNPQPLDTALQLIARGHGGRQ